MFCYLCMLVLPLGRFKIDRRLAMVLAFYCFGAYPSGRALCGTWYLASIPKPFLIPA